MGGGSSVRWSLRTVIASRSLPFPIPGEILGEFLALVVGEVREDRGVKARRVGHVVRVRDSSS
jgi:hypothetical protein